MKNSWKKALDWLILLLLLLILARFATQTYARMLTNSNSGEGDQLAFLQLGLDMREQGVLTDGTRNPLYAAFLALFARREWAYFTYAKLLSLTFGGLAIIALYLLGRRYFNPFTGLVAAYLLSINVEFIVHSATALTESLLVLTFILAWFAMVKALDHADKPLYWLAAGLLAGLAYLAKGSGQLLVFAFLGGALLCYRFHLFRTRGLWLFLAGYALVASPLWLYNTIHFGSPTFNYPITHQMWLESWDDWHPDDTGNLPTLRTYLQSHTPADIWQRQWQGMKAMRNVLIKTLWPTRTLKVDQFLLSPWSGYLLAGLALLPLLFWPLSRTHLRQNRSAVYLTGLVVLLFFMLFAWYDAIVALGQRFLLPVIPLIFILFAHILSRLGRLLMRQGVWAMRLVLLAATLVMAFQLHWAVRTSIEPAQRFLGQNVFAQDRQFNATAATPLAWLAAGSGHPPVVVWGPSSDSLPTWAYSDRLNLKLYPPHLDSILELTHSLAGQGVQFVIVDPEIVSRYEELLEDPFPSNGAQIELTTIPPGWALTYAYPTIPCNWCVFRLLASYPPQHPVDYRLGRAIALIGYDLKQTRLRAGDTLSLTLHWAALARPEQDYTVFTQLLGPDLQLYGQEDHQPLESLWPTGRWQPGDRLADRYDMVIDPAAPPGSYRLLVGMYNGQTGERQPVTQHGQPVPDNAIRLATITLTVE